MPLCGCVPLGLQWTTCVRSPVLIPHQHAHTQASTTTQPSCPVPTRLQSLPRRPAGLVQYPANCLPPYTPAYGGTLRTSVSSVREGSSVGNGRIRSIRVQARRPAMPVIQAYGSGHGFGGHGFVRIFAPHSCRAVGLIARSRLYTCPARVRRCAAQRLAPAPGRTEAHLGRLIARDRDGVAQGVRDPSAVAALPHQRVDGLLLVPALLVAPTRHPRHCWV